MVNTRRSELEIIDEILDLSKNGAKTTELLYQCNLSYTQLKNYIAYLLEKNIIEEKAVKNGNGSNKLYVTTERGNHLRSDIKKTLNYLR